MTGADLEAIRERREAVVRAHWFDCADGDVSGSASWRALLVTRLDNSALQFVPMG